MDRKPQTLLGMACTMALVIGLSGCATSPSSEQVLFSPGGSPIGASLSQFMENANTGQSVNAGADSPWGSARIEAGRRYYAASGRICRELIVERPGYRGVPGVACRVSPNEWVNVRAITHGQGV